MGRTATSPDIPTIPLMLWSQAMPDEFGSCLNIDIMSSVFTSKSNKPEFNPLKRPIVNPYFYSKKILKDHKVFGKSPGVGLNSERSIFKWSSLLWQYVCNGME